MTRQEAIEHLQFIIDEIVCNPDGVEALTMAIYALGTIDELKKERDAALDTAFAALRMREDRKGG